MPTILDERGDTVHYEYPPPVGSYVPNELIIRFKANALKLWKLCYVLPGPTIEEKKEKIQGIPNFLISRLMSQRFYVDDLILDTNLLAAIKSFGGDTLSRITWANPCSDTISISRYGDTLKCEDYLWLALHLNNDINAILASFFLTKYHQNSIIIAQPNFIYELCSDPPNDELFNYQISLNQSFIGIEKAWEFTTGKHEIKIGIIDNGFDYRHPDLGAGKGPDKKVTGGWSYLDNNDSFWVASTHGTEIAGIIGALTNNSDEGVAGIAGGWCDRGEGLDSLGCQLIGYNILRYKDSTDTIVGQPFFPSTKNIIAAIRVAIAWNPPYGYAAHILNNSYGDSIPDPALWAAVHLAFEHGVSFIAARGNAGNDSAFYPACFFPSGVISVGGSESSKKRWSGSQYSKGMDLIAPAIGDLIMTTQFNGGYKTFDQTSAATAHVTGVVGLLRSFALEKGWHNFLEPEDYEGMLKASAEDIYDETDTVHYSNGYDSSSAWGHLQADNIFNMLNLDNDNRVYWVSHFSSVQILDSTDWSGLDTLTFYNEGRLGKLLIYGKYKVKKRIRFGIISLPTNKWLVDSNLYVWGRSGQGIIGGYSGEKPNYQTRWTMVTSGTGGNGLIEGIIHNDSLNVAAYTFQYQVWDSLDNYIGVIPPDDQIALNISVFGKEETPVDVKESKLVNNPYDLLLSPNPANDELNISFILNNSSNIKIEIFNYIGQIIYKTSDLNLKSVMPSFKINLGNINSGIYYCRANINGTIFSKSFVVLK